MEDFVVHKFGGTSVGNASCFQKVSDIISTLESSRVAVVVSAIGGKPKVTDLLISLLQHAKDRELKHIEETLEIIRTKHNQVIQELLPIDIGTPIQERIAKDLHQIRELLRAITIMSTFNDNVVEFISGHGEIWSAQILSAVLTQQSAKFGKNHIFHYLDARDFLIVETNNDSGPVVQYEETTLNLNRILSSVENQMTHVVITGFICSTREGVMTTLKRDGSDFTASIVGRCLKASSVTIWTDVSGVLSADPRRVPESQILPQISYEEAMELAYFGAKVIHPKTMAPAIVESIPIYIRNTFEPEHPGTKIYNRKLVATSRRASYGPPTPRNVVSGFSTVDDLALFNVEGSGMVGVHGVSSRLFSALDRVKVSVVLIAQASSEHSICFAVPKSRSEEVLAVLNETFFNEIHHGLIDTPACIAPISIIAAVGDAMSQTPGVSARFFGALGRAKINILGISQGSSERNISAVVDYEASGAALRAVHSAFFLSDQTISIGIFGLEIDNNLDNTIGSALIKQCELQTAFLKERFNVDIRIRAIATHTSSKMILCDSQNISYDTLQASTDSSSFQDFDHDKFLDHLCADHMPNWLMIDVHDCEDHVKAYYEPWLNRNIHIITSNLSVAAASNQAMEDLLELKSKKELTFDTEACLPIGVPVLHTLQNFIRTGDTIERVEYSGSLFLNSIFTTPCDSSKTCTLADCIQQAVNQIKHKLSVKEILQDACGLRSAKKAILIMREMGFSSELKDVTIENCWEYKKEEMSNWNYDELTTFFVDNVSALGPNASSCCFSSSCSRLLTRMDGQTGDISVRVEQLDKGHPFENLQASQCGFAFYTKRHGAIPIVVTGPIADHAITAGTLFSSILTLARNLGTGGQ